MNNKQKTLAKLLLAAVLTPLAVYLHYIGNGSIVMSICAIALWVNLLD